jgi:uncharacterized protein YndB with AHSA1/START domain
MTDTTDGGSYVEVDGRPAVRFVRMFAHDIERVWTAVTRPDELAHWFPARVAIDLRVGGEITFGDDPRVEDQPGVVLVCDPPRHLAFTWGDDELHFDLETVSDGHCRFTLTNVLHEANAAARNAAGWSVCLGELDKHVAGQRADGPHSQSAQAWQPLYDHYRAAGLPSGAAIPERHDIA